MDVYSTWIHTWHRLDHVSWSLGLSSNTTSWRYAWHKPWHHGTPHTHNRSFILFNYMWKSSWIELHWKNIWLRTLVKYGFTLHLRVRDHTNWFWKCVGTAFGHFLVGHHNFMVTAVGLCVWSGPKVATKLSVENDPKDDNIIFKKKA